VGCDIASLGDSLHFVPSFPWVIQSGVILLGLFDSEDAGSSLPTDVASNCRRTEFIVGVVTRLLAGQSGARIPVGGKRFFFLKNVHTCCVAHPASY
jgi:hypothetical protein